VNQSLALNCVRELEESVDKSQLVHQFEGRRMEGVAPEITVEVVVGLKQHDIDSLPRQEERQDCARRPAADDAAAGLDLLWNSDVWVARTLLLRP